MRSNRVPSLAVQQFFSHFVRFADCFLFNKLLQTQHLPAALAQHIAQKVRELFAVVPVNQGPTDFENLLAASKLVALKADAMQPFEVFNTAANMNPQTVIELLRNVDPPLKPATLERLEAARPVSVAAASFDPYAFAIDRSFFNRLLQL